MNRLETAFSPEKNAMMTLVSRRTLPAIRLDLFASFLDGMRHGFQVRRINRTYEAHKLAARRSGGHREAARVIQNLPLLRHGQAVNLLDNLVFDRLRHNETNLGKGFRNVKGPRPNLAPKYRGERIALLPAGFHDFFGEALSDLDRFGNAAALGHQSRNIRAGTQIAAILQILDANPDGHFLDFREVLLPLHGRFLRRAL